MESSPSNPNRLINYRPMLEIAVGLMIGIVVHGRMPSGSIPLCGIPFNGMMILGAALILACSALAFLKQTRSAFMLGAIIFGILLASVNMPAKVQAGDYDIQGTVTDIAFDDGKLELTLSNVALDGRELNKKLLLIFDGEREVSIGDNISTNAYVKTPSEIFENYNERNHYLSLGIGVMAYADEITVASHNNASVTQFLHGIRTGIVDKANEIFGSDGKLMSALLVGERYELAEARTEVYRITGTAHLLAISGFHMGAIVAVMRTVIPKGQRKLRTVIIGLSMLFYCTISVYAPGLVRSAIMTFCMLLCSTMERRHDSLSALALAAVLILLINPYQFYSIGFQLSLSACLGIILLNKPIKNAFKRIHIPLASMIAVTTSATLATMMLQMRYYGTFSTYTAIGNIIAIPAFTLVLFLGIVLVILGIAVPQAAVFLANVPRAILFVTEKLLGVLSKLPLATIGFRAPSALSCVLFLLVLFAASEYVLRPAHKRMELALIAMLLFTSSVIISIIPL